MYFWSVLKHVFQLNSIGRWAFVCILYTLKFKITESNMFFVVVTSFPNGAKEITNSSSIGDLCFSHRFLFLKRCYFQNWYTDLILYANYENEIRFFLNKLISTKLIGFKYYKFCVILGNCKTSPLVPVSIITRESEVCLNQHHMNFL